MTLNSLFWHVVDPYLLRFAQEDKMKAPFTRSSAAAMLLAGLILPAHAQVTCDLSAEPSLARFEGNTELIGDIVVSCTGGTPTPANLLVPQADFRVFLNTNVTSRITHTSAKTNFSEALMLVDEPNRGVAPSATALPGFPLLNCGQLGAPDSGPLGPGICEILQHGRSDTNLRRYAGRRSGQDLLSRDCGGGRLRMWPAECVSGPVSKPGQLIVFPGVPFDPPGVSRGDASRKDRLPAVPLGRCGGESIMAAHGAAPQGGIMEA
jgi:hypothetical protein